MTTSFFLIFSEHPWDKLCANLPHLQFFTNNCVYSSHTDIKLCTYCLYRHTTVLIHEILYLANQLWCSSLLLPHLSSSLTDSLPSLNLLYHSKTDARFMQDGQKAVWSVPYVSVAFFPNLKQNFTAYRSSKVSSCPDCIFEIHQRWQSGFSRVYSISCCSCLFEAEIIKIGQSSHKMYSNKILNFQESTTILNAHMKKVWKLIEGTSYIWYIFCIYKKSNVILWINNNFMNSFRLKCKNYFLNCLKINWMVLDDV